MELPKQIEIFPVMLATGGRLTVIVWVIVAEQLKPLVTTTVYVVVVVGEMVIEAVVADVFHE